MPEKKSFNHSLNGYETTFLVRLDMADAALQALKEKLTQVIESFHGTIVLTEDWGKRKLAYPIDKQTRAHYMYIVYTGQPAVVAELERHLKLQEDVMRFLTVKHDHHFDPKTFKARREELNQAQKRREEEQESYRDRDRNYSSYDKEERYTADAKTDNKSGASLS